jgi:hypothetical protein
LLGMRISSDTALDDRRASSHRQCLDTLLNSIRDDQPAWTEAALA